MWQGYSSFILFIPFSASYALPPSPSLEELIPRQIGDPPPDAGQPFILTLTPTPTTSSFNWWPFPVTIISSPILPSTGLSASRPTALPSDDGLQTTATSSSASSPSPSSTDSLIHLTALPPVTDTPTASPASAGIIFKPIYLLPVVIIVGGILGAMLTGYTYERWKRRSASAHRLIAGAAYTSSDSSSDVKESYTTDKEYLGRTLTSRWKEGRGEGKDEFDGDDDPYEVDLAGEHQQGWMYRSTEGGFAQHSAAVESEKEYQAIPATESVGNDLASRRTGQSDTTPHPAPSTSLGLAIITPHSGPSTTAEQTDGHGYMSDASDSPCFGAHDAEDDDDDRRPEDVKRNASVKRALLERVKKGRGLGFSGFSIKKMTSRKKKKGAGSLSEPMEDGEEWVKVKGIGDEDAEWGGGGSAGDSVGVGVDAVDEESSPLLRTEQRVGLEPERVKKEKEAKHPRDVRAMEEDMSAPAIPKDAPIAPASTRPTASKASTHPTASKEKVGLVQSRVRTYEAEAERRRPGSGFGSPAYPAAFTSPSYALGSPSFNAFGSSSYNAYGSPSFRRFPASEMGVISPRLRTTSSKSTSSSGESGPGDSASRAGLNGFKTSKRGPGSDLHLEVKVLPANEQAHYGSKLSILEKELPLTVSALLRDLSEPFPADPKAGLGAGRDYPSFEAENATRSLGGENVSLAHFNPVSSPAPEALPSIIYKEDVMRGPLVVMNPDRSSEISQKSAGGRQAEGLLKDEGKGSKVRLERESVPSWVVSRKTSATKKEDGSTPRTSKGKTPERSGSGSGARGGVVVARDLGESADKGGRDVVGKSSGIRRTKTQAQPAQRRGHSRTDSNTVLPSGRQHANTISVVASSRDDITRAVERSRPSLKTLTLIDQRQLQEMRTQRDDLTRPSTVRAVAQSGWSNWKDEIPFGSSFDLDAVAPPRPKHATTHAFPDTPNGVIMSPPMVEDLFFTAPPHNPARTVPLGHHGLPSAAGEAVTMSRSTHGPRDLRKLAAGTPVRRLVKPHPPNKEPGLIRREALVSGGRAGLRSASSISPPNVSGSTPTRRRAQSTATTPNAASPSTPTSRPTSPAERHRIRHTALGRVDEIVRSGWSQRDLSQVPQSPTLFGALADGDVVEEIVSGNINVSSLTPPPPSKSRFANALTRDPSGAQARPSVIPAPTRSRAISQPQRTMAASPSLTRSPPRVADKPSGPRTPSAVPRPHPHHSVRPGQTYGTTTTPGRHPSQTHPKSLLTMGSPVIFGAQSDGMGIEQRLNLLNRKEKLGR